MANLENLFATLCGDYIERFSGTDVVLLGDSITQGLGSKRINFAQSLEDRLGKDFRVLNLAYTGTTVDFPFELIKDKRFPSRGGVCVILYGNVDAQLRPCRTGRVFPMIPVRFRKNGMLMPRPFYSRKPLKRLVQHADNTLRKLLSSLIVAIDGKEQWVSANSFRSQYETLIKQLIARNFKVFCCSTVFIDDRLFKGCLEQYRIFNANIKNAAEDLGAGYVDIFNPLMERVAAEGWDNVYNKDHFHPNGQGYQLMADLITLNIENEATGGLGAKQNLQSL